VLVGDELTERKREIRAWVRDTRSHMGEDRLTQGRVRLTARLSELVLRLGAGSLSCFQPTRNEPDVGGFLEWARHQGINVLLPAVQDDGSLDWIRPNGVGSVVGAYGIEEPEGERLGSNAPEGVDLMLVPAAAVDVTGNRLGWGLGYFDRALASLSRRPPVYAVVHDHEVLDSIPVESHDIPMDGVITPERTLVFASRR